MKKNSTIIITIIMLVLIISHKFYQHIKLSKISKKIASLNQTAPKSGTKSATVDYLQAYQLLADRMQTKEKFQQLSSVLYQEITTAKKQLNDEYKKLQQEITALNNKKKSIKKANFDKQKSALILQSQKLEKQAQDIAAKEQKIENELVSIANEIATKLQSKINTEIAKIAKAEGYSIITNITAQDKNGFAIVNFKSATMPDITEKLVGKLVVIPHQPLLELPKTKDSESTTSSSKNTSKSAQQSSSKNSNTNSVQKKSN